MIELNEISYTLIGVCLVVVGVFLGHFIATGKGGRTPSEQAEDDAEQARYLANKRSGYAGR